MRSNLFRRSVLLLALIAAAPAGTLAQSQPPAQPAPEPVFTLSGDGLTMVVRTVSGDALSGDIVFGGATYKFTGQRSTTGDAQVVKGSFLVGTQSFDFETLQKKGQSTIAFTSGGKTYTLQGPAAANPLAKPPQPANPLATPPAEPTPAPEATPAAAPAILTLSGDGLTVRVRTISDDQANLTGDLTVDGKTYPFTARFGLDENDSEVVQGSFRAGSESVPFSTAQDDDDNTILTLRGRKYRLQEVPPGEEPALAPAANPGVDPAPAGSGAPAGMPAEIRMRRVEFRDINMNNVPAFTMLVPEGWQSEGHIEWSNERTPYPQTKITVTGPDQSRVAFFPAMKFEYSESTPGAPYQSKTGTPPPENLGQWIVALITQTNHKVTNVRLVSDQRNAEAERAVTAQAAANGGSQGGEWQVHLVTIAFELGGVPFTEEISINYAKNPWINTQYTNMISWILFINSDVSAPTASFAASRPLLYASAQSLRAIPKWWTQQQQVLMEITRSNHQIGMEQIKRRGQFYDQMSDANFADWKKQQTVGDSQQNDRINSIYEVEDFRDTDGMGVKLPIHYQNYYSDGNGNYIMSNTTTVEPGSEWTKIEPEK